MPIDAYQIKSDFMKIILFICLFIFSLQASAQPKVKNDRINLSLAGLWISGHTLSFDLMLFNHSLLAYEPRYIKFFIRERHIASRTAVQEREIHPLVGAGSSEILADSHQHVILNFDQFTIPNSKELVIEVKEKNGARDLELRIPGHRLFRMIRLKKGESNHISIINKNQVYE
jgi:Domain of unknown function (DUF4138)